MILIAPLAFLLNGVAIMVTWRWFVAPAFGLSPIGYATALGLDLAVSAFVPVGLAPRDVDEAATVAMVLGKPLFILAVAGALRVLMGVLG